MKLRLLAIAILVLLFGKLQPASAEFLTVILSKQGSDVKITISGSGTVVPIMGGDPGPGMDLDFEDFTGTPFTAGIGPPPGETFTVGSGLTITGMTPPGPGGSPPGTPYTASVLGIKLVNDGVGMSDIVLMTDYSFLPDSTYTASGMASVDGLLPSDLGPDGIFTSTSDDSLRFGGESLKLDLHIVTGIPEPTSFLLFGSCLTILLGRRRRQV